MADRSDDLQRARRVERAVNNAVTRTLFTDEPPSPYRRGGPSLLADLRQLGRGQPDETALDRMRQAGVISRTVADTTTTDVPALLGVPQIPGWVQQVVDRRQAANLALLDALRTARLTPGTGGIPFVMHPSPPQPATVQTVEKTELGSRTFTDDDGESVLPTTIAETGDFSRQVLDWAGDETLVLLVEDVVCGVAAWVLAALAVAATPAADLPEALAAVETAWPADTLISSRAAWAATVPNPQLDSYAGIGAVLGSATGDTVYVASSAGVLFEDTEPAVIRQPAPSVFGGDITAAVYAVIRVAPGAVAAVTPP